MWPNNKERWKQFGNSFSSCLLTLVIVFGGLGFYYFNYFQWRHFEAPLEGLTYAKENTAPQLNDFRKKAEASVIDPARQMADKIQDLRKSTRVKGGGYKEPEDMEQDVKEIRNRLLEIMTEARLRRIPKKFDKRYQDCLLALQDLYYSVNYIPEIFGEETTGARENVYKKSLKEWKEGEKRLNRAKAYFRDDGGWKL